MTAPYAEGTSGLPATPRLPRIEAVVGAYLDNYSARRGDGIRVFPSEEPNLVVALLYLGLGTRMRSSVCRAVARWELQLATELVDVDIASPALNMLGYLLAAGQERIDATPPEGLLELLIERGEAEEAVSGVFGSGWRAMFLAALPPEALRAAHRELDHRVDYLRRKARQWIADGGASVRLNHRARLTFMLAYLGDDPERADLRSDAANLITGVADESRDSIVTAHLAEFVLAAKALEMDDVADEATTYLLETRLDPDRRVLRAISLAEPKLEFSPWVPLALSEMSRRIRALEAILDPPASAPPSFAIERVHSDRDAITYELRSSDRTTHREYDTADLNALLRALLDQVGSPEIDQLSPRLRAHIVHGLFPLLDTAADDETRTAIATAIHNGLTAITRRQLSHGGWGFGRENVPSLVYTAANRKESEFPALDYSIDASVPGIALCQAFEHFGDESHRAAAERAFDFFENELGQIERDGLRVWLLYPGDDKTVRQGTAVNYELWAACFFSAFANTTADPARRARALGYVDDAIAYTARHLEPNGDISYGDYVSEKRTPYASWDAYLLAVIARLTGKDKAQEMAARILARVAEVMLPSGGIPNVVPYYQDLDAGRRWLVHRHGVGPYPMRGYYHLYYVAACAAAAVEADAGLRAFGFVLTDMYEPVLTGMSTGYFGDGRYDDRPDSLERIGRDWLLLCLGSIGRISSIEYAPRVGDVRAFDERLQRGMEDLYRDISERFGTPPVDPSAASDLGLGCLALHEGTGDDKWLDRATRCGVEPVSAVAAPAIAEGATLEQMWETQVEPTSGRPYAVAGTREPMRVDEAAELALSFLVAGEAERGWKITRYLLHTYRDAAGSLCTTRAGGPADAVVSARAFRALARIAAVGRPYPE